MTPTPDDPAGLGHRAAVALVFGSSAAVLVVEIVALRLLAPYLGLTLETSTLVIGIALAAIALGSWGGGRIADLTGPRRLIGPALGISGAVVALTPAVLRTTAEAAPGALLPAAMLTIMVPGTLLSAVTPMATKLRLDSLERTGTVVGQLSGVGTLGAIVGTVVTGFVLISRVPVTAILLGLGATLVLAALPMMWAARSRGGTAALALAVGAGGLAAAVAPGGCDVETTYHCANVETAPNGSTTLVLDNLRHSAVDLDDPRYLEFEYIRAIASVTDTAFPEGEAVDAYHLGAGGLTIPRYLAAERPGTRSVVSEIDGGVVRIDEQRLGLGHVPGVDVRVEDGRLGLRRLADDSRDLVVGDAFGGVSVPWHLTTREALADVRRVLRPDGVYVANLIDYGEQRFARAEVATMRAVFDNVMIAGQAGDVGLDSPFGSDGGNLVAIASDRPLDPAAIRAAMDRRDTGWTVRDPAGTAAWVGDAQVLTDDYAPVDQLLQPYTNTAG
ncbi:fused MFS/spermidine synthase [Nocardioides rotundus]|uniref:fused MFS/spermidine synthase n=1 Tax=Nocardioides rotundus TaxID=1774216 RepID=UPI001CC14130|nr:fused MFS/spermidine synthase [Nocardioides rotundus]